MESLRPAGILGASGQPGAFTREIVSLHGGSIAVESKVGEGTLFRLKLQASTGEQLVHAVLEPDDDLPEDALAWDGSDLEATIPEANFGIGNNAFLGPVSTVADLDRDGRGFFLTFTIEEGERYQFGYIDIESALPSLNVDGLHGAILTRPGRRYNAQKVEKTVEALTIKVSEQGYAFGQVRPRFERQRSGQLEGDGRTEDDFAFLRDSQEFRNLLLAEQPNGDFGDSVVRQFLFESFYLLQLESLSQCSDTGLAEIAARAGDEAKRELIATCEDEEP